ncbi:12014_t:CDS:2 [Cetraspora pellucida]|uniref:12014_t:CDS:1 n=1 Tax=Cetraspora pellucida TaxID=1433469 RepID=A0ACA9NKK7_9GLOM|nr:12014_t:CDS:2 [Cetraspora pellucida]
MEVVKLNLKSEKTSPLLREVARHVARAKRCIIITGAGISCSGGIPDFSSSDGLYSMIKSQYPGTFRSGKDLFDAGLLRNHESIKAFYLFMGVLKELIVNATPTATHFFIKKLADMKKLKRVYTQNIDNLEELVGLEVDWQLERVKHCQAQVVQLHGTMAKLRCSACTSNYSFATQYCDVFKQGEAPNCPGCEEREDARIEQGRRPHTIGQLKPTVILYGDSHPKGLEICQIAEQDKDKADCLVIMGTSLRIPGVKALIKDFARAVHDREGYVILVNATDVVTKEWNGLIDYQIEGTCDEWVKLVEIELSNIERMTATRLLKSKSAVTNNKEQDKKERKKSRDEEPLDKKGKKTKVNIGKRMETKNSNKELMETRERKKRRLNDEAVEKRERKPRILKDKIIKKKERKPRSTKSIQSDLKERKTRVLKNKLFERKKKRPLT